MTNRRSWFMFRRKFVALGSLVIVLSVLGLVSSCTGPECATGADGCPCTTPYECDLPNGCYSAYCDGTCHVTPFPMGTGCWIYPCEESQDCWGVCTAEPQCVECLQDADCPSGHTCEVGKICSRCDDRIMNGDETGVDCGGSCPLCPGTCNVDMDCPDGYCWEGLCVSCHDGIQNGDETGVDCGPSGTHCLKCLGMNCSAGGDWVCVSKNCENDYCCPAVCPICTNCEPSGACEPLPFGSTDKYGKDPAAVCDGDFRCNGQGHCLLNIGKPCAQGSECFTNVCMNGKCD